MNRTKRKAFTLTELLVVITIIGMLASLLLPAVQRARESGRRTTCANNMRELAKAIDMYQNAKERYPGYRQAMTAGGYPIPSGFSGGTFSAQGFSSWYVAVSPFAGNQNLNDNWLNGTNPTPYVRLMVCASDPNNDRTIPQTSYVVNCGMGPRDLGPGIDAAPINSWALNSPLIEHNGNGIFFDLITNPSAAMSSTDIDDGLSHTLMLSENVAQVLDDHDNDCMTPPIRRMRRWDQVGYGSTPSANIDSLTKLEHGFLWLYAQLNPTSTSGIDVDGDGMTEVPTGLNEVMVVNGHPTGQHLLDQIVIDMDPCVTAEVDPTASRPSAYHTNMVNVAFADGSVRQIHDQIAYIVYQHLMTPKGANSWLPDKSYLLSDEDYSY